MLELSLRSLAGSGCGPERPCIVTETTLDQADYFLKELALGLHDSALPYDYVSGLAFQPSPGEYTMPIVGMMSVFDWSEVLEMHHQWTGREWFVARTSATSSLLAVAHRSRPR